MVKVPCSEMGHSQTFVGVKSLHACLWHFPGVKLATQVKKVCPDTASMMPAYCYLAQSEGYIVKHMLNAMLK